MIAFLDARLGEDERYLRTMIDVGEQAAVTATPADIADAYALAMTLLSDPRARQIIEERAGVPVPVPNDLKRLLCEVEAKRAIVTLHKIKVAKAEIYPFSPYTGEPNPDEYEVSCEVCGWADSNPTSACATLCFLAAIYSDHPDYRKEWAAGT